MTEVGAPGESSASHRAGVLPGVVSRLLPPSYVTTLECVAAGDSDQVVARRVGVDLAAVPSLVRLAIAKLLDVQASLAAPTPDPSSDTDDGDPPPGERRSKNEYPLRGC